MNPWRNPYKPGGGQEGPMRPTRRAASLGQDRAAVTAPLGTMLLIGIVIVLVAVFVVMTQVLRPTSHEPVETGARATFYGDDGYWLEPSGPDDVPVAGSTLYIRIDGGEPEAVPLSAFASQLGGPAWTVGTRICIVGPEPDCYRAAGQSVEVVLYSEGDYVFVVEGLLSAAPSFTYNPGGAGGVVLTPGNHTVRLDIVGAQITCGESGPEIPVTARFSSNGGTSYAPLFGGLPVDPDGGQTLTYTNLPGGSALGVEGRARLTTGGCNFDETYNSFAGDPHVLTLRAGDAAPDKPAYGDQQLLAAFMAPYVNTYTQTMVLDHNQVILLFEFNDDLGDPAADFQDLVVLFTFD